MMEKYSYNSIKGIYTLKHLCDSDNKLLRFLTDKRTLRRPDNSIFICAGLGLLNKTSLDTYSEELTALNEALQSLNSNLFILRDDIDDITLYRENKSLLSNIFLLEDVSMIETNLGNVLCIGGRTLLNRSWYMKRKPKDIDGYYDRSITLSKQVLDEISENHLKFNIVVSNILPSFINLGDNKMIYNWSENDKQLIKDIDNERTLMDNLYCIFRNVETDNPKYWEYTTYVETYRDTTENVGNINFFPINVYPNIAVKDKNDLGEKVNLGIKEGGIQDEVDFSMKLPPFEILRRDDAFDFEVRDVEQAEDF